MIESGSSIAKLPSVPAWRGHAPHSLQGLESRGEKSWKMIADGQARQAGILPSKSAPRRLGSQMKPFRYDDERQIMAMLCLPSPGLS